MYNCSCFRSILCLRHYSVPLINLHKHRGGSRERVQGVGGAPPPPPPPPAMTCGFLIQLVFCGRKKWFIGVEFEQETSAPLLKKNPGSAPETQNASLPSVATDDGKQFQCFKNIVVCNKTVTLFLEDTFKFFKKEKIAWDSPFKEEKRSSLLGRVKY